MKENIEYMAGLFSMAGAIVRAIKKKLSSREAIANVIVAGVLSFAVMFAITWFLPMFVHDIRVIIFITFFIGYVSADFTAVLEKSVLDFYEILHIYIKSKFNK